MRRLVTERILLSVQAIQVSKLLKVLTQTMELLLSRTMKVQAMTAVRGFQEIKRPQVNTYSSKEIVVIFTAFRALVLEKGAEDRTHL